MKNLFVVSHACFTAINRNVYRLMVDDGWNVFIVAPAELHFPTGSRKADVARPVDPAMIFLPLRGRNPRTYHFEGLKEVLDERKPALILLDNDPVSLMAKFLGQWSRKNGAVLTCLSNENLPLDIRSGIHRRGFKALIAILIKRTILTRTRHLVAGVLAINHDGEKIFRAEGFRNVQHTPLGFDPVYFHPDDSARSYTRQMLGLADQKLIAYFGRLSPEKGIHVLINALADLRELPWTMVMDEFDEYATGYTREIKELLAASNLADRVLFIKPDHFQIAGYFNAVDLVVVPSVSMPNWKEQYGRVAAEAMACGKTVFASDSGSLPELLAGHGSLFPEGDAKALARLLAAWLQQETQDRQTEGQRTAAYALAELSIIKQKEIMEHHFLRLLDSDKTRGA